MPPRALAVQYFSVPAPQFQDLSLSISGKCQQNYLIFTRFSLEFDSKELHCINRKFENFVGDPQLFAAVFEVPRILLQMVKKCELVSSGHNFNGMVNHREISINFFRPQ